MEIESEPGQRTAVARQLKSVRPDVRVRGFLRLSVARPPGREPLWHVRTSETQPDRLLP